MYHSITFGDKNTWDDWCMIPETDPIIEFPSQKTNFIDIPGADGSLDMSEALTGYPVYNNREGSLSFIVMNDKGAVVPECNPLKLRNLASNIANYLHGKSMNMVLEDDRGYFYKGRFTVNSVSPDQGFSKIEIGYSLEPYKWSTFGSMDNWIWDTFNFQTGIVSSEFSNLPVTTSLKSITLQDTMIGNAPVTPEFRVTSSRGNGIQIRFLNDKLSIDETKIIPDGTTIEPDFIMYGSRVTIFYRVLEGTGTLSINYRQGRL